MNHQEKLMQLSNKELPESSAFFLNVAETFSIEQNPDEYLIPVEFTVFYNEAIWHELSASEKIKLNHLTWCMMYLTIAMTESKACILNHKAANNEIANGRTEMGFYMMREATEETYHIQAFLKIIKSILNYYNISFEEFVTKHNTSSKNSQGYYLMTRVFAFYFKQWNFYYLTRYSLNILVKCVERTINPDCNLNLQMTDILIRHRQDEARHMTMSLKEGVVSFAKMGSINRRIAAKMLLWFMTYLGLAGQPPRTKLFNRHQNIYIQLLGWVGVSRIKAKVAYKDWVNSSVDKNTVVTDMRRYYISQNVHLLKKLNVSEKLKDSLINKFLKKMNKKLCVD